MKGRNKFLMILILGMLSAIGPFSIDMYLPGFSTIAKDLHTTISRVTLSLSSFFIGISMGQLLYGPILDRYGRKKPVYVGLSIYLLASIACSFCKTVDALIFFRFIQAVGACAGMVASRAFVRDVFPVEENAKVFSLLMLVIGVSPIIAPTLGGYVTAGFGWPWVFVILSVMAAGTLIAMHFYLPDGRAPDTSVSFMPAPIIRGFLSVIKEPQFYTYAFTGAIASAGLYAYISGSPFVFMELFHVSEKHYGWIFAIVALGLIISSQLNSLVLRKYKSEQIIRVALLFQTLTGLTLLLGSYYHFTGLYSTVFLCMIFLSCQGFTFPNSSALSMAPFSRNAGSASALMGAIQLGIGAIMSATVGILSNNTSLPMTGVMFGCALSSFIVLMIGRRAINVSRNRIIEQELEVERMSGS